MDKGEEGGEKMNIIREKKMRIVELGSERKKKRRRKINLEIKNYLNSIKT